MVSFYYPRDKHLFLCSQITNVEEYNCKTFNLTKVFFVYPQIFFPHKNWELNIHEFLDYFFF
jgi:hypothetical protein